MPLPQERELLRAHGAVTIKRNGGGKSLTLVNGQQRLESLIDRLFGYAMSLADDRSEAEDILQDCIVRALAAKRVPRDEAAYRAWCFRVGALAYVMLSQIDTARFRVIAETAHRVTTERRAINEAMAAALAESRRKSTPCPV